MACRFPHEAGELNRRGSRNWHQGFQHGVYLASKMLRTVLAADETEADGVLDDASAELKRAWLEAALACEQSNVAKDAAAAAANN